jgi:predicted 2-oxoglutarate/Fe(II)-dependent dioxygenase YbiX/peroxiredoxin
MAGQTPDPVAGLVPGEPAPAFVAHSDGYRLDFAAAAGPWTVLLFFGTLAAPAARAVHDRALARLALFDGVDAALLAVSIDPSDKTQRGLANRPPGLQYLWDIDLAISRAYGVFSGGAFTATAVLLDRAQRIVAAVTADRIDGLLDRLEGHLDQDRRTRAGQFAPVLSVERVFEPEFCAALIAHYQASGGAASGFMTVRDGMTVPVVDETIKRRRDVYIADAVLRREARERIRTRLVPMIERAFGWRASRIERYLIGCYDSHDQGFFRPHRDNISPGVAHRKFAVTLNLNDAYDGGELRFPEFGARRYKAEAGGAVVFSGGLLHEVAPVTAGVRFAFIPFLYDEEGARLRAASAHQVVATAPQIDEMLDAS